MADGQGPIASDNISKVVIAGGGTAGWMAAAVLARSFGRAIAIELVESEQIGTVGVGEATIPQIRLLTSLLGVDEHEFMRSVAATIKLGIQFNGWGVPGDCYMHAFGRPGRSLGLLPFYPYWLRARRANRGGDLWDYSLNCRAALRDRYDRCGPLGETGIEGLVHAFHFDAALVAQYLRNYSIGCGVIRTEGRIVDVDLDGENGRIAVLRLDRGRSVTGELFIDCTGFAALLIGKALGVRYEDWTAWLPCDRAIAQATQAVAPLRPYTQAFAAQAGWRWRIPLQHRTGNGHVYCSRYVSDDQALEELHSGLDADPLGEPKLLRFVTGARETVWKRNCVALGLAAGFMEPLESTSIHLVQSGLQRLLTKFPRTGFGSSLIDDYNSQTRNEYLRIRDFLILHYHANHRPEAFWRERRGAPIPGELQHKIDLFRIHGQIDPAPDELFTEAAWLQVFVGQGIQPGANHPLADRLSEEQLYGFLDSLRGVVAQAVDRLPSHADYIAAHCAMTAPA